MTLDGFRDVIKKTRKWLSRKEEIIQIDEEEYDAQEWANEGYYDGDEFREKVGR